MTNPIDSRYVALPTGEGDPPRPWCVVDQRERGRVRVGVTMVEAIDWAEGANAADRGETYHDGESAEWYRGHDWARMAMAQPGFTPLTPDEGRAAWRVTVEPELFSIAPWSEDPARASEYEVRLTHRDGTVETQRLRTNFLAAVNVTNAYTAAPSGNVVQAEVIEVQRVTRHRVRFATICLPQGDPHV